jgi:hydroxypyruvate isomerase
MPRFSANLGFLWSDLPLLDRIACAAAAGFEAVELHWPYDVDPNNVRAACDRAGVRLLGINAPAGDALAGEFGFAALAGREADMDASFARALDWAVSAGASAMHVLAGIVPEDAREHGLDTLAANLGRWAGRAEDAGISLLLEPMNRKDRPGYVYTHSDEAAAVIARVGAPNVRLMLDTYHVGMEGRDPASEIARHLPILGHVQVAATPTRAEPDHGTVDHPALFRLLDRLGYAGHVGAEYRPRGRVEDGLGWMRGEADTATSAS